MLSFVGYYFHFDAKNAISNQIALYHFITMETNKKRIISYRIKSYHIRFPCQNSFQIKSHQMEKGVHRKKTRLLIAVHVVFRTIQPLLHTILS